MGTLAEYCASFGGQCPTYQDSVARHKALCAPYLSVTMHACGHAYRSVGWQGPLVGGEEEYFEAGGRLIGAYRFSDYNAYCDGSSFSQTFGTIPTCATRLLEVRFCRPQR